MFVKALLAALLIGGAVSQTPDCIRCICGIESHGNIPGCGTISATCDGMYGCIMDLGSCSCGPYQIKSPYFTDCSAARLPIKDWYGCATNEACAEDCVYNYMKRYGTHCTGKPYNQITCEEFGGIHNGGPSGCKSSGTAGYRNRVRQCCAREIALEVFEQGRSLARFHVLSDD